MITPTPRVAGLIGYVFRESENGAKVKYESRLCLDPRPSFRMFSNDVSCTSCGLSKPQASTRVLLCDLCWQPTCRPCLRIGGPDNDYVICTKCHLDRRPANQPTQALEPPGEPDVPSAEEDDDNGTDTDSTKDTDAPANSRRRRLPPRGPTQYRTLPHRPRALRPPWTRFNNRPIPTRVPFTWDQVEYVWCPWLLSILTILCFIMAEDKQIDMPNVKTSINISSNILTDDNTTTTAYNATNSPGGWHRNLFEEGIEHQPGPGAYPFDPKLPEPLKPGDTYRGLVVKTMLIERQAADTTWGVLLKPTNDHPNYHQISPNIVLSCSALHKHTATIPNAYQGTIAPDDLIIGYTDQELPIEMTHLNMCIIHEALNVKLQPNDHLRYLRLFYVHPPPKAIPTCIHRSV